MEQIKYGDNVYDAVQCPSCRVKIAPPEAASSHCCSDGQGLRWCAHCGRWRPQNNFQGLGRKCASCYASAKKNWKRNVSVALLAWVLMGWDPFELPRRFDVMVQPMPIQTYNTISYLEDGTPILPAAQCGVAAQSWQIMKPYGWFYCLEIPGNSFPTLPSSIRSK